MPSHYIKTNTGSRPVNEDCGAVCSLPHRFLAVLADGLGGHAQGDVAARLCVDTAVRFFKEKTDMPLPELLPAIFLHCQDTLLALQEETHNKAGLKSTLTVLLLEAGIAMWGHIGDTRLYHFRSKKLLSRTRDHSVPQMLLEAGEIRGKDLPSHPDRNRLLRVMGIPWETPLFVCAPAVKITPGTSFLLCTDGFWEAYPDASLRRALRRNQSAEGWIDQIFSKEKYVRIGKMVDNHTVIGVKI